MHAICVGPGDSEFREKSIKHLCPLTMARFQMADVPMSYTLNQAIPQDSAWRNVPPMQQERLDNEEQALFIASELGGGYRRFRRVVEDVRSGLCLWQSANGLRFLTRAVMEPAMVLTVEGSMVGHGRAKVLSLDFLAMSGVLVGTFQHRLSTNMAITGGTLIRWARGLYPNRSIRLVTNNGLLIHGYMMLWRLKAEKKRIPIVHRVLQKKDPREIEIWRIVTRRG